MPKYELKTIAFHWFSLIKREIIIHKILMILVPLAFGSTTDAQMYQTQTGTIQVNGKYKGESVVAVSNQLNMHLNYESAEMHLKLVISTLNTENDSLRVFLQGLKDHEVTFKGRMNIVFVQTESHPKQSFVTQGTLLLNGVSRSFSFNAVLEHVPRGNTKCILSGEFIIHMEQFNIEPLNPGEGELTIKFNQLVLKRPGEN